MRKYICTTIALLILIAAGCAQADTSTTYYKLTKPSRGAANWDTKTNTNWDTVDQALHNQAVEQTYCCDNLTATNYINIKCYIDGGTGTEIDPWTSSGDNAAGIQTALNTGVALVIVPPGYYLATSPIEVFAGQRVRGYGPEQTFIKSTAAGYGISVGDPDKAGSISYSGLSDLTLICSGGSSIDCLRYVGLTHGFSSNVKVSLSSCSDTNAIRLAAGREGTSNAAGVLWNSFYNMVVWAGSSGDNTGINVDGNNSTWTSGRSNINSFYQTAITGGQRGLRFGASENNNFYGIAIESLQIDDADAVAVYWDNGAQNNKIYGLYLEPGSTSYGSIKSTGTLTAGVYYKIVATEPDHFGAGLVVGDSFTAAGTETCDEANTVKRVYRYLGKSVACVTRGDVYVGETSVPNNPTGNMVIDPYMGAGSTGTHGDHFSVYGSNYIRSTSVLYVGLPEETAIYDDNSTEGNSTAASAKNSWPIQIRVPTELSPRMKIGLSGILLQNDDNETTDMHVWASGETGHSVLYPGGATNRCSHTAKDTNPDLSKGNNFYQTDFGANTSITGFENALGAPTVLYYPLPTADGLTVTFEDNQTDPYGVRHRFLMYEDSDAADDNVTIAKSATGWVVTLAKKSHRYPMQFGCWFSPDTNVRVWMITNKIRALDTVL